MYLISIEGGDGSGKGLATKVVSEVLQRDFSFTSVEVTGEPRREHPLGDIPASTEPIAVRRPHHDHKSWRSQHLVRESL